MESQLEVIVSHEQGRVPVTVFHIIGDVDGSNYSDLERQAQEAYETGTRALLLDLSKVPYMSSAGLQALHSIFNLMRSADPDESDQTIRTGVRQGTYRSPYVKLLNPTPHVLEVLRISGFDMYLEIHKKLKDAVASF